MIKLWLDRFGNYYLDLSAKWHKQKRKNGLRVDGLLVNLDNVHTHSSGCVEFLAASGAFEVLGSLMGDQDLFIFEISLAVPIGSKNKWL